MANVPALKSVPDDHDYYLFQMVRECVSTLIDLTPAESLAVVRLQFQLLKDQEKLPFLIMFVL